MHKHFHNLVMGISVLPALLICTAQADEVNYVARVGDSLFESLDSAIAAVEKGGVLEGQTVTVLADIPNGAGKSVASGSDFVIDFNGKKFTAYEKSVGSVGTETQVLQMLRDSTITLKNGTIDVATTLGEGANFYMGLQNYANLTLDNMVIDGRNLLYAAPYTVSNNFGTINIKNSKLIAKENGFAFDVWRGLHPTYTDVSVNVENSEIIGRIEVLTAKSNYAIGDNVQELVITGGTMAAETGPYRKLSNNATVTLNNLAMNGNFANESGAAIYNEALPDGYSKGIVNINNVDFMNNKSSLYGGAIYNKGVLNLSGKNNFAGNTDASGANDIYNVSALNIVSGTTTISSGISGTGVLTVADGATLNIGDASIIQDKIHLNGTMIARLNNANNDYRLNAMSEFDGTGTLALALSDAGEYKVFGGKVFESGTINMTDIKFDSPLYNLSWTDEGKSLLAVKKTVEEIVEKTHVSEQAATTVSNLSESTSEKLNDLSVLVQEKLVENTEEAKVAVENATKAIHPESESVMQSVTSSVQNTVTNLASSRMTMPTVGRSAGDAEFTSGGVWVQGIFNKSKQNDAFSGYTRGIAAGLDGTINKQWTIGAGYSFASSDIASTARNTEIDTSTLFVYGQYKPNEWYANAVLNYTTSDYYENGSALGMPVQSEYNVNSFGANIATGYDFDGGVTPELGLRYMHIMADDYTNSLGVKNKWNNSDYLTASIGTKYAFDVKVNKHLNIRPELRYAVKYDIVSDKQIATVTMPGINSYTVSGERLSRIGGEFGIGIGTVYRGLNLSLNYDIEAREDYTSQSGRVKVRCDF